MITKFHFLNNSARLILRRHLHLGSIQRNLWKHGRRDGWEGVIGLEVHAQIEACSKLFSSTGVKYGASVNSRVSHFDAGIPGTLPVLNRKCVEAAVLTSLALGCRINKVSRFDRKHYFYADLPTGYQITQNQVAVGEDGELSFIVFRQGEKDAFYKKNSKIRQIQLEQDSGKSLHDPDGERSLIDLNRAGVPLLEIVFEPDLSDGEEAASLVKELILILSRLGISNCKMEEGSIRVDANVSIRQVGGELGTRTEVKNLSSIRSLVKAIDFELERQRKVLEGGGVVINETRSFDVLTKATLPMRDKEIKQDYRFMPEPNLPPLRLTSDFHEAENSKGNLINISLLRGKLKNLPEVERERLRETFGLRLEMTFIMLNIPGFQHYFEAVMGFLPIENAVRAANILQTVLMEVFYERDKDFTNCPISSENFAHLVQLVEQGKLNLSKTKDVLERIFDGDTRTPSEIVLAEAWIMVSDDSLVEVICHEILSSNPKICAKYQVTKHEKHINKLMGEVRKATVGNYDMKKVEACLRKLLRDKMI